MVIFLTKFSPNCANLMLLILLDSNCTDSLKESLASALRHSRNEAERTYDRRMAGERKAEAISLTRDFAEESVFDISARPGTSNQQVETPQHDGEFQTGDFVGLIEESSTLSRPQILIGQIHSFPEAGKVSLLWYQCKKNLYALKLDGTTWIEDKTCIVPVDMSHAKNKPGQYRLTTSLRSIHKALASE